MNKADWWRLLGSDVKPVNNTASWSQEKKCQRDRTTLSVRPALLHTPQEAKKERGKKEGPPSKALRYKEGFSLWPRGQGRDCSVNKCHQVGAIKGTDTFTV